MKKVLTFTLTLFIIFLLTACSKNFSLDTNTNNLKLYDNETREISFNTTYDKSKLSVKTNNKNIVAKLLDDKLVLKANNYEDEITTVNILFDNKILETLKIIVKKNKLLEKINKTNQIRQQLSTNIQTIKNVFSPDNKKIYLNFLLLLDNLPVNLSIPNFDSTSPILLYLKDSNASYFDNPVQKITESTNLPQEVKTQVAYLHTEIKKISKQIHTEIDSAFKNTNFYTNLFFKSLQDTQKLGQIFKEGAEIVAKFKNLETDIDNQLKLYKNLSNKEYISDISKYTKEEKNINSKLAEINKTIIQQKDDFIKYGYAIENIARALNQNDINNLIWEKQDTKYTTRDQFINLIIKKIPTFFKYYMQMITILNQNIPLFDQNDQQFIQKSFQTFYMEIGNDGKFSTIEYKKNEKVYQVLEKIFNFFEKQDTNLFKDMFNMLRENIEMTTIDLKDYYLNMDTLIQLDFSNETVDIHNLKKITFKNKTNDLPENLYVSNNFEFNYIPKKTATKNFKYSFSHYLVDGIKKELPLTITKNVEVEPVFTKQNTTGFVDLYLMSLVGNSNESNHLIKIIEHEYNTKISTTADYLKLPHLLFKKLQYQTLVDYNDENIQDDIIVYARYDVDNSIIHQNMHKINVFSYGIPQSAFKAPILYSQQYYYQEGKIKLPFVEKEFTNANLKYTFSHFINKLTNEKVKFTNGISDLEFNQDIMLQAVYTTEIQYDNKVSITFFDKMPIVNTITKQNSRIDSYILQQYINQQSQKITKYLVRLSKATETNNTIINNLLKIIKEGENEKTINGN